MTDMAKTQRLPAVVIHESDGDCAGQLDEHDTCRGCGVYHGDQCGRCGGRGFHVAGCRLIDEDPADIADDDVSAFDDGPRTTVCAIARAPIAVDALALGTDEVDVLQGLAMRLIGGAR